MDTKKLRQKILDLAIRGKLVPQDPKDEPASLLLERIRAEKERLIKEGKIKRSKKTAANDDVEVPFEIPNSWEWVRLCDITELIEDCLHSTAKDEGYGYPLIRTPNVGEGYLILDGVHRVSETVYNKRNARAVPETNDIIYAREAPAGNAAVIQENEIVCLGQRTVLIRPFKKFINPKLLAYFIISPHSKNSLISTAVGSTATHVNLENIRPFNIPIPPLSEQKRIANEIERWFSVIDELESNEDDLVKAIDKAKSKILDLAIHGKLVPQDPNDEPAIELLKRISPKFEPCDDEYYWDIPSNWILTRVDDIGELLSGRDLSSDVCNNESKGIPYLIGASNISGDTFSFVRWTELPQVISILGDVLISCKGTIGAIIENNVGNIHIARQFMAIRPKNHCISSDYLKICLLAIIEGIKKNARGVIPGISRDDILEKSIPLPPINEQPRIVSKIEEVFKALDALS